MAKIAIFLTFFWKMARNRAVWDIDMSRVAKNISFVHTFPWKKNFFEKTAQNATKATFFNRSAYFSIFWKWAKIAIFLLFFWKMTRNRAVWDIYMSQVAKNISFGHTFSWKKSFFETTAQNATKATFFNKSAYFSIFWKNRQNRYFLGFYLKTGQKSRCPK